MAVSLAAIRLSLARRIHQVSVQLEPGSITALCGPNGAGKSTLLQCLAGLLAPGEGEVMLDGTVMTRLPATSRAKAIGYLPQTGEIAWDLSVEALVRLGRLPHRDLAEARVAEMLAALDLTAMSNRPMSTLSGGERARVLLARVLAGDPRWILADEPLAALDLAHQHALLRQLREIANTGVGVVLAVHDLAFAMNHADRVLVLKDGQMIADGAPEAVLDAETIAAVWKVSARWLGEVGARALVTC